ncbi:hypothetical protein B0H11DRAFT_1956861 [Mycena galericulata]|nr:hypothetical protein B0H11DRAFT_1956861 [Mycena galericulata]
MSASRHDDIASPGGELPSMNNVEDTFGRSLSEFSWASPSELSSVPPAQSSFKHAPTDPCDRQIPFAAEESTPKSQVEGRDVPVPRTPGRLSCSTARGSNASEIFERPSADPYVSPNQLPALCDHPDSDDELFEANRAEHSNDEEEDAPGSMSTPAPELTEWLSQVEAPAPSLPDAEFNFTAPSTAPTFPSHVHVESPVQNSRPPSPTTLNAARILVSLNANAVRKRSDGALVTALSRMSRVRSESPALHKRLLAHSDPDAQQSYAKAPPYIQRSVRHLLLNFPVFRVDAVTPTLDDVDERFTCMFPGCEEPVDASRAAADAHVKAAHWPDGKRGEKHMIKCPKCPESKKALLASSMGRHMLNQHAAEQALLPTLHCGLCKATCEGIDELIDSHFPKCQVNYRSQEPASKRQRLE